MANSDMGSKKKVLIGIIICILIAITPIRMGLKDGHADFLENISTTYTLEDARQAGFVCFENSDNDREFIKLMW